MLSARTRCSATIYARLAESLPLLFARVDAVLAAAGFDASPSLHERSSSRVTTDSAGAAVVELTSAVAVPFSLAVTSAGFWTLFSRTPADLNKTLRGVYEVRIE